MRPEGLTRLSAHARSKNTPAAAVHVAYIASRSQKEAARKMEATSIRRLRSIPWPLLPAAACGLMLSACTLAGAPGVLPPAPEIATAAPAAPADPEAPPPALNAMIGRYAAMYGVPESLIRRIIVRESDYNPAAHHGPYWGLMQIRYDTARSMGYDGPPAGLLDADTNLRYGCKYLFGAYRVAQGDMDRAVGFYAAGYFYDARRMGLLQEVGLKRGKS